MVRGLAKFLFSVLPKFFSLRLSLAQYSNLALADARAAKKYVMPRVVPEYSSGAGSSTPTCHALSEVLYFAFLQVSLTRRYTLTLHRSSTACCS